MQRNLSRDRVTGASHGSSSLEIYKPVARTAGRPVFQRTVNRSKKDTLRAMCSLTTKEEHFSKCDNIAKQLIKGSGQDNV